MSDDARAIDEDEDGVNEIEAEERLAEAREAFALALAEWRTDPDNQSDPVYAVYELVEGGSGTTSTGVSLWATLDEAETYR